MVQKVTVDLSMMNSIDLELNEKMAPKTVQSFLDCLPLQVRINVWGEELYTDETPIDVGNENSKSIVDLMDVAYWPEGKAICLFFGPTPISKKDEIKPYSAVNVIGKIKGSEKSFPRGIEDGLVVTFRRSR